MKVKSFFIAVLEAITSTLRINRTNKQIEVLDLNVLNAKSIEDVENEFHESLDVIIEDYSMTMKVKKMFLSFFAMTVLFGAFLAIYGYNRWSTIVMLLISFVCYKLYENRKQIGEAKHSFIQFTISNEVESEKAKKIPGYQMRNPGIYEDNLN